MPVDPITVLQRVMPDKDLETTKLAGGERLVLWPADKLRDAVLALVQARVPLHLSAITAVEDQRGIWLLYHFWTGSGLTLRVLCSSQTETVPSLVSLLPVADWYEREAHDLLGIHFEGHPSLDPLLLVSDWDRPPPLRKTGDSA